MLELTNLHQGSLQYEVHLVGHAFWTEGLRRKVPIGAFEYSVTDLAIKYISILAQGLVFQMPFVQECLNTRDFEDGLDLL